MSGLRDITNAIEAEQSCANDLYLAACSLMRYKEDANCWHNLQNAAHRLNAAMQYRHNASLRDEKPSGDSPDGNTELRAENKRLREELEVLKGTR